MSTSVRLPDSVETDMARVCAARGITKSELLTAALKQYLRTTAKGSPRDRNADVTLPESAIFKAFGNAGLIGKGDSFSGITPDSVVRVVADKARVREVTLKQLSERRGVQASTP